MLAVLLMLVSSVLSIWPEPISLTTGGDVLWLHSDLKFFVTCSGRPLSLGSPHNAYVYAFNWFQSVYTQLLSNSSSQGDSTVGTLSEEDILVEAIGRVQSTISSTQFVPWKLYSRTSSFEPDASAAKKYMSSVQISQLTLESSFSPKGFFAGDESYDISISAAGVAKLTANSTIGTIRALQTFEQLFYMHSSGGVYMPSAPLTISDAPEWPHRGLNLDISRNYFAPQDVLRTIDAMATAKFSRLHLHATDGQSWPIEVPSLPHLAMLGAYQPYLTWSPNTLAEVQAYGLYRGISVFIETDMPGHTGAIANGYPELITAFNESDWATFAAEPGSGQLKLNSTAVYDFLKTLFGDLLPRLSPYTTTYHNGGDEVNNNAYLLDETVQSNSSAVLQPLVQELMSYVTGLVRNASMQPIVWEEMLLNWNLTLPSAESVSSTGGIDTIVQVWQNSANLLTVLQKGYRGLFGDYNHWYLDCGHGGFINPYPSGFSPPGIPYNTSGGVPTAITDPFLDYCDPYKNWRHIYVYDPLGNITSDLEHLIEGGEVHLWSEQSDPVVLDQKVWPRAASAAEVMWSGPRNASMIEAASKRLAEWRERVVLDHGVQAGVVQMTWCLMEGGCDE